MSTEIGTPVDYVREVGEWVKSRQIRLTITRVTRRGRGLFRIVARRSDLTSAKVEHEDLGIGMGQIVDLVNAGKTTR